MQLPNHNKLAIPRVFPSISISMMPPALTALISQVVALMGLGLVAVLVSQFEMELSLEPLWWGLMQGIFAALVGHYLGMARWWLPINLVFVPAILLVLTMDLSPLWFLGAFLLLLLVYGKVYRTQVPLYLSSGEAIEAVASLLPKDSGFSFVDLGSGCGGLLQQLNKIRPDGTYHGIEAAPLPFILSKCRSLFGVSDWRVSWGDFWQMDLSQHDVVYAYLSPVPMALLWRKVRKEMRPGSILISNSFVVPGIEPEITLKLGDFGGSTLYLWRI